MNEQLTLAEPRARLTDGPTAHEAASVVAAGNAELISAIRRWVFSHGVSTQEEIAIGLAPDESVSRWRRSTIITACARAGLTQCGTDFNRRGRRVALWGVETQTERAL